MNIYLRSCLIFVSLFAFSLSPTIAKDGISNTDREHIANLKKGELRLLKRTAKIIIRDSIRTPAVLDVATEVLLQAGMNIAQHEIHTFTHLARAIGESKNPRYYSALKEVKEKSNSKHVRKWAKKGYKMIGKAKGPQYKRGMTKLSVKIYK